MKILVLIVLSFNLMSQITGAELICENNNFKFIYAKPAGELYEKVDINWNLVEKSSFVKSVRGVGEMGDYHDVVILSGARLTMFQIIDHSFVEAAIDNKRTEDLECTGIW